MCGRGGWSHIKNQIIKIWVKYVWENFYGRKELQDISKLSSINYASFVSVWRGDGVRFDRIWNSYFCVVLDWSYPSKLYHDD